MKTKNILYILATLSGRYDLPNENYLVHGYDMYGRPMTEIIPAVDGARMKRDIDEILASSH